MTPKSRVIAPISWMALLWIFSSVPGEAPGGTTGLAIPEMLQNALHVPAYAVLAAGWLWVVAPAASVATRTVWVFSATAGYGVLDEIHQSFVPGRTCSSMDAGLDAGGAGLALVLHRLAGRRTVPRDEGPTSRV